MVSELPEHKSENRTHIKFSASMRKNIRCLKETKELRMVLSSSWLAVNTSTGLGEELPPEPHVTAMLPAPHESGPEEHERNRGPAWASDSENVSSLKQDPSCLSILLFGTEVRCLESNPKFNTQFRTGKLAGSPPTSTY